MHLIEFENYEVRPTEEFFMIKPLRDLYTKYHEKDWEKFMQYVSFIYHYADPRSTYAYIVDDDERMNEIIKQEGFPKSFKAPKEVWDCIDVYKKRIETPALKLLKATLVMIDNLSQYMQNIDLDERDDKGKPVHTISTVTQAAKQVPQLAKDVSEAMKTVAKEIEESGRARGGNEKNSVFEDGVNF